MLMMNVQRQKRSPMLIQELDIDWVAKMNLQP